MTGEDGAGQGQGEDIGCQECRSVRYAGTTLRRNLDLFSLIPSDTLHTP